MKKTTGIALAVAAGMGASAEAAPQAQLSNSHLRMRVYLPDKAAGFYRGTRFDWSGVIGSLEYAGHDFYPLWFQRTDPKVHDFIYAGSDIVAGPCTAITGPVEEFNSNGKALGFDEAKPGETFIKIGVGVLRRPDDRAYDPYHLYEIVDGGQWTVEQKPGAIRFRQVVADPSTGYGYEYWKEVALTKDLPQLVLSHGLRNTGKRPIQTSVYNHNFLYLDSQPPGPDFSLTLNFPLQTSPLNPALAAAQGNQLIFKKVLSGQESVYFTAQGFSDQAKDYDLRIENRQLGVGLRITADRPLSRLAFWSIRAPLCPEPFISMDIQPGTEFTWRIQYDHYTL